MNLFVYRGRFGAIGFDWFNHLFTGLPSTTPVFEVDTTSTLIDMYKNYPWGDLWWESGFTEVAQYLRASKKISIPAEWREILPDYVLDEPMED